MNELTRAEEQVMQVLWKLKKGFVKDMLEFFPNPKPAYNTISTIVRILEKKGYISYTAYGKTHEYFPLVTKNQYRRLTLKTTLAKYFGNSPEKMLSFFIKENNLSVKELEEILHEIKKSKKK